MKNIYNYSAEYDNKMYSAEEAWKQRENGTIPHGYVLLSEYSKTPVTAVKRDDTFFWRTESGLETPEEAALNKYYSGMTQWHIDWQNTARECGWDTEVRHWIDGELHIADAERDGVIIEFEHSKRTSSGSEEVYKRTQAYNKLGFTVYWFFDCTDKTTELSKKVGSAPVEGFWFKPLSVLRDNDDTITDIILDYGNILYFGRAGIKGHKKFSWHTMYRYKIAPERINAVMQDVERIKYVFDEALVNSKDIIEKYNLDSSDSYKYARNKLYINKFYEEIADARNELRTLEDEIEQHKKDKYDLLAEKYKNNQALELLNNIRCNTRYWEFLPEDLANKIMIL